MSRAPARDAFLAALGFELDPFQVRALDALDAGRSVLVAAPTGSGKTVVAEYAVAKALDEGRKAFYTTPLKALSNQKFGDLSRRHGPARVGLLTGDNSINGDAPVVVMTTEVLRNMIYADSPALRGLRYVVLDEVHYLQDPYRGPVWEEVIIHSPPDIDLVCLSATVSNAEEFADWVETVRGDTAAVIEEQRPVELHHLYMVGDRESDRPHLLQTFVDGRPNPEAARLDARSVRTPGWRGRPRGRLQTPRRIEVIERLHDEGMLPAIYFIFSRNACDDAARQCLESGMRLTSPDERTRIREVAEAKVDVLTDADLDVLGYSRWLAGLEAGFAAHHAGMVPPFKEAVETCFAAGLVKAVFATETLALGINMPARSVVIEKLTKFTGERHEFLTPGQYTQLTGRAGRRGIDDVGYAVVLWSPFVPFDQVAGLASTRTYALSSSFRPTYNMAANLVRRYPPDTAHHLLNLSFAQFRADRDVVRLETQLERNAELLAGYRESATCDLGNVEEYRALLRDTETAARVRPSSTGEVVQALDRIKPGDVLVVPGGKSGGRVAVIGTTRRRGGDVRLRALTPERRMITLSPRDFPAPPRPVGRIDLPTPYAPSSGAFQRTVAADLSHAELRTDGIVGVAPALSRSGDRAMALAAELDAHAVSGCPDLHAHLRAAERAERLARDTERLERRIRGRTESLARQFDRVLRVLEAWGYVDGWALTDSGAQLARIYHECDLLVAECLRGGLFDGLDPPSVVSLASTFSYEQRGRGAAPGAWFPTPELRKRWGDVERLARELELAEHDAGLPLTRAPDPGFAGAAHASAAGEELAEIIGLLRQLGEVAGDPQTASAAREAADRLFRGVVAASAAVDV
ncbi:MAG: DEAD/DEAH box helicase [Actinobacteria bacterium]|nr:MAG: DEAD/DEAH box helicase [Actinomycetota bacterium]